MEAYLTKTEKTKKMVQCMLRDIISRFEFIVNIESDNEPAFEVELLQLACKTVNIKWKLPTMYRPQSSGMVEKMNWDIKVTLAKWV